MDLAVTGIVCLGCLTFGSWLVLNRSSLDAAGEREDPNTYISAGYRAFIVFGIAAVAGAAFFIFLLGKGH